MVLYEHLCYHHVVNASAHPSSDLGPAMQGGIDSCITLGCHSRCCQLVSHLCRYLVHRLSSRACPSVFLLRFILHTWQIKYEKELQHSFWVWSSVIHSADSQGRFCQNRNLLCRPQGKQKQRSGARGQMRGRKIWLGVCNYLSSILLGTFSVKYPNYAECN